MIGNRFAALRGVGPEFEVASWVFPLRTGCLLGLGESSSLHGEELDARCVFLDFKPSLWKGADLIAALKKQRLPVEEVKHLEAELGTAIRKVISRLHRLAPSLEGQYIAVIESRLKAPYNLLA